MTPEQLSAITSAINEGAFAIVGTMWALIFAVTWKG